MASFRIAKIALPWSAKLQRASRIGQKTSTVQASRIAVGAPPYHAQAVEFAALASAALTWFLLHALVAGTGLRRLLVARVGEKAYRGGFSLASLCSLWWLVHEYGRAPYVAVGRAPLLLGYVPIVLVPVALVLFAGAFLVPNPTAVGGERLLLSDEPARGLLRVTRHPFLWAAALWGFAHLLVNWDAGSLLFFGSIAVTALRGTVDIDRKRRRTNPQEFSAFEARTSNLPFQAIAAGRNRLVLREVWLPVLLGLALALGAVALHPRVFGRPALPGAHG